MRERSTTDAQNAENGQISKLDQNTPDDAVKKHMLFALAYAAALFFFLEVVFFSGLRFTTSYFYAQLVVAAGLSGFLIGNIIVSLAARPSTRLGVNEVEGPAPSSTPRSLKLEESTSTRRSVKNVEELFVPAMLALPAAPLLGFAGIAISASDFLGSMLLLAAAFVPIGVVIGIAYRLFDPWLVYAAELGGGVSGLAAALFALPALREENALFAAFAFSAAAAFAAAFSAIAPRIRGALFAIAVVGAVFVAVNVKYDFPALNLAHIASCGAASGDSSSGTKVACLAERQGTPYRALRSLGSIVDRIDIIAIPDSEILLTAFSGNIADTIRTASSSSYRFDPRVPAWSASGTKALVIGAAAEGVAKVVKAHGFTDITAVELNPAIVSLWQNDRELSRFAREPFRGVKWVEGDARAFLDERKKRYDLITMMNTHRAVSAGDFGEPDFLHTKEAFAILFGRLSSDGVLVFEEPHRTGASSEPIRRIARTLEEALREAGVAEPRRHVILYVWSGTRRDELEGRAPLFPFFQFAVKKEPWNDADASALLAWAEASALRELSGRAFFNEWLALPPLRRSPALQYEGESPPLLGDDAFVTHLYGHIAPDPGSAAPDSPPAVLTDRRPFSASVADAGIPVIRFAAVFATALAAALLFWFRQTSSDERLRLALPAYALAVGVGYMFIEVALIIWFQFYIGSVLLAFAAAVGGLLAASALGSILLRRISRARATLLLCLAGVGAFSAAALWAPEFLPAGSLAARFAAAALLAAALGFAMAPFFPLCIERAKARFGGGSAVILVGLDGAAMALSVPLAFAAASVWGVPALFIAALALYLFSAVVMFQVK